jgi:Ca-activated chloride channel family protein
MVNYESLIIELNRQLVSQNKEPLYAVYPQDGLAVADSPLGYLDRGDGAKSAFFKELQTYLLGADAQQQFQSAGCRTGAIGLTMSDADTTVFNPAWGINTKRSFTPIRFPAPAVLREALDLYQTAFRKPSFTVYCLDYSGSMQGEGSEQLKSAMRLLLRTEESRKYLLQPSPADVTIVIPFNQQVISEWKVRGNGSAQLEELASKVVALAPDGNTNIYSPTARAIALLDAEPKIENYFPAIVLMTDGQSNNGALDEVKKALQTRRKGEETPVYAVLFGDASEEQLKDLTQLTSGKIFDGRKDLVTTFREVKGYN